MAIVCMFAVTCRCRSWVVNCRRADLDSKSALELHKNYYMCANHFEPTQFTNSLHNYLNWNAVPTIFNVSRQL